MKIRYLLLASLLVSPCALAQNKQVVDCQFAVNAQYKKQTDERDAIRLHNLSKPTTVQEVLTGRRMLEAYCLRYATCVGKPELLGKNFEECLDQDAAEMVREQDDLHAK